MPTYLGTNAADRLDAVDLGGAGVAVTLDGLGGADTLIGGTASDKLFGRGGNDTFETRVGEGFDVISGGGGFDTVVIRLTAAQAADAAFIAEIAALQALLAAAPATGLFATSTLLGVNLKGIEALTFAVDPPPPETFAPIRLADIEAGIGGFAIRGEAAGDDAGISAVGVGDIDGDGLDDLLIGAWFNDAAGTDAGAGYFIRGKTDGALVQLAETIADDGGFRITGESAFFKTGKSVSPAGDVNGDGYLDLLIGAPEATVVKNEGASYVIFGGPGFAGPVDLDAIAAGIGGFKIAGESVGDRAGKSNADAGDINGDGLADLIVGARADDDNGAEAGAAYVVFGKADGLQVSLSAVASGIGGFKIRGELPGDSAGYTVAGIGDANGDGVDDLLIGANEQDGGGLTSGAAYVVFGKADTAAVELSAVAAGQGGFKIIGEAAGDKLGIYISPTGDVNGDGFADMIIGANGSGVGNAGAAFVVFGKADGAPIDLDTIAAGQGGGFKISGVLPGDDAGEAVADAGDVNGDGLADLLVGARYAAEGGVKTGAAYLVFGKTDGAAVSLADVKQGIGGVALLGDAAGDKAGVSVSSAGDVNGDGLADILVAADGADGFTGLTYVIFGRADWQLS